MSLKLYLRDVKKIRLLIQKISNCKILWLDTEIADWQTNKPRLSLIQGLAHSQDTTGDNAWILDVLDKPDIVEEFIAQIMANPNIKKVFHNADFDLKYLGQDRAKNIICTLKIANQISLKNLGTSNRKLKTLARELCHFDDVDSEEQISDWGQRPLSQKQLHYAKMDVVYLAHIHKRLLAIIQEQNQPVINDHFSVTKVRIAFECPRLFYLAQHFGGKTLFLPPNHTQGVGTKFHKLAEDFIDLARQESRITQLFQGESSELKLDLIVAEIEHLFYELVFFPNYLQPAIINQSDEAQVLHTIWIAIIQIIHKWVAILITNRAFCQAKDLIKNTFIAEELNLEYDFNLPNGKQQQIKGKLDSLLFDFEKNRLCVVEYKTYMVADLAAQLAQVALYGYMLKTQKQLPVDCAVYCVFPEFKEYYYSWEQLEDTINQLIPYKLQQMQDWVNWKPGTGEPPPATLQTDLCGICPQQTKCQSFFESSSKPKLISKKIIINLPQPTLERGELVQSLVKSDQKDTICQDEVTKLGNQLVQVLAAFKVEVVYLDGVVAPRFIRIKLKPNLGVKVVAITKLAADLQVQLGISALPMIATQAGYVSIDIPRQEGQIAYFDQYVQKQVETDIKTIKIAVGIDLNGQLIEADLSDSNTCHFLVGGTTGSGKSEFLRSLVLSLLYHYTPQQLQLVLVDPKRVTFPEFEQIPWLLSPIVKDSDSAIALMQQLVIEMENRYQLFELAKCPHISSYNHQLPENSPKRLPHVVCIFDEYADFMAEKESKNALEQSIKRLGSMARAAGIHLIISTQRPEAGIVTPIIRSNLPGRIALRTASEADAMIILGGKQTEAAYLLGKGDLIYQVGANWQRLQSLFAEKSNFTDLNPSNLE